MTQDVIQGKLSDAAHPVILSQVIILMIIEGRLQLERGRSPLIDRHPLLLRGHDIWIGFPPDKTILVEITITADRVVHLLLNMIAEDRSLLQLMLMMLTERSRRRKLKRST